MMENRQISACPGAGWDLVWLNGDARILENICIQTESFEHLPDAAQSSSLLQVTWRKTRCRSQMRIRGTLQKSSHLIALGADDQSSSHYSTAEGNIWLKMGIWAENRRKTRYLSQSETLEILSIIFSVFCIISQNILPWHQEVLRSHPSNPLQWWCYSKKTTTSESTWSNY